MASRSHRGGARSMGGVPHLTLQKGDATLSGYSLDPLCTAREAVILKAVS
jgi:hypothetical protein